MRNLGFSTKSQHQEHGLNHSILRSGGGLIRKGGYFYLFDFVFRDIKISVCVCLFPSTIKASPDWTERWMYCQIYRPAMLCWGKPKGKIKRSTAALYALCDVKWVSTHRNSPLWGHRKELYWDKGAKWRSEEVVGILLLEAATIWGRSNRSKYY